MVVAAARDPAKSAGLQDLKAEHPNNLFLVTLDVTDEASAKVGLATVAVPPSKHSACSPLNMTATDCFRGSPPHCFCSAGVSHTVDNLVTVRMVPYNPPCLVRVTSSTLLALMAAHAPRQAAAEAVAEHHPGGIDYLIVNAGIHDRHYGPGITA